MDEAATGSSRNRTMFGQRLFKFLLVEPHLSMPRAQQRRSFGGVNEFIVRKTFAVADGVGRPVAAMLVHQRQQQPRIQSAAQENAHRHVGQQVPFHRRAIQFKQFFRRVPVARAALKTVPA